MSYWKLFSPIITFSTVLLSISTAQAVSFDCHQAVSIDEQVVCANPTLSELDSSMSDAYAKIRMNGNNDDRTNVLSDARYFVYRRHQCGNDTACLVSVYMGAIERYHGYGVTLDWPSYIDVSSMVHNIPPETYGLPLQAGVCTTTHIRDIGGRLEGDNKFESGTSVMMANGGYQVSYERQNGIISSKIGDKVLMCLISIPRHCPPGDGRGRTYTTTNLRTHATWTLPDSEHMCGGA
jgi:uncharacterized protein